MIELLELGCFLSRKPTIQVLGCDDDVYPGLVQGFIEIKKILHIPRDRVLQAITNGTLENVSPIGGNKGMTVPDDMKGR